MKFILLQSRAFKSKQGTDLDEMFLWSIEDKKFTSTIVEHALLEKLAFFVPNEPEVIEITLEQNGLKTRVSNILATGETFEVKLKK